MDARVVGRGAVIVTLDDYPFNTRKLDIFGHPGWFLNMPDMKQNRSLVWANAEPGIEPGLDLPALHI